MCKIEGSRLAGQSGAVCVWRHLETALKSNMSSHNNINILEQIQVSLEITSGGQ